MAKNPQNEPALPPDDTVYEPKRSPYFTFSINRTLGETSDLELGMGITFYEDASRILECMKATVAFSNIAWAHDNAFADDERRYLALSVSGEEECRKLLKALEGIAKEMRYRLGIKDPVKS